MSDAITPLLFTKLDIETTPLAIPNAKIPFCVGGAPGYYATTSSSNGNQPFVESE